MAKNNNSKAPGVRVSPGKYRDAKGNIVSWNPGKKSALTTSPKDKKTAPTPQQTMQQNWYNTGNQSMQGLGQQFGYAQQQGAFTPGSFADTQRGAYDAVMNEFNRSMQPQFQRQEADFNQLAAERGLDPNSEAYKTLYSQMQESQNQARQSAMNSAFGQGLGAQQQGYNQAAQTYRMPYEAMGAYSPFYGQQGSYLSQIEAQRFASEEAARAHGWDMEKLRFAAANQKGGGGGGGPSLYDQLAIIGAQQGQQVKPNYGNAAVSGIAQGIGAGITAGLTR
jgi:hypothetical protein